MTTVRARGIYATALTARLDSVARVVDPSAAIRNRFDQAFKTEEPTVSLETTQDREGISVWGESDGVQAIRDHVTDCGIDALSWVAPAPQDAVLSGTVVNTTGGGAVVDLGEVEGYLPFEATEEYIDVNDVLRVRVSTPVPPWADSRPVLSTEMRIQGALATLERGVSRTVRSAPTQELARLTEMLDPDLPAEWGIRWAEAATTADVEALEAGLDRLADRARVVEQGIAAEKQAGTVPREVASPNRGVWVWFGRESRSQLDTIRRNVVPTLAGHHRIKAGSHTASSAVDFAERLGAAVDAFPVGPVLDQFGPHEGDQVGISHGKPAGRCYSLGQAELIDCDTESGTLTVEREIQSSGTYDALEVAREQGDIATSRFREGRWWYPTTYRSSEGTLRGTYLNVNTPVELFPDAVRYVDLHVDVVKWPDGEVSVVDRDELAAAVDAGHVPGPLAERARTVAEEVASAVRE